MDKFTKTTEIDISAMTEMDDETPKKSNVGNIIAFICCLIFAIFIWLFVMEIDSTIHERAFDDIYVEVFGNEDAGYTVSGDLKVDVVLTGVSNELADVDKDDIRVIFDFSKVKNIIVGSEQEYSVDIELSDDVGNSVSSKNATVKLTINKKA